MNKTMVCPHCKKTITLEPKRICAKCQNPIGGHDKYTLVTEGGKTFLEHRHCDNPTDYFNKAERKAWNKASGINL